MRAARVTVVVLFVCVCTCTCIGGVGKGGAGGVAAPHFLRWGGIAPTFFSSDDNLSSAMPLHISVYRTNGNI